MNTIFTISTSSHLFKSFALRDSLKPFGYSLTILLVDDLPENIKEEERREIVLLSELLSSHFEFQTVFNRYKKRTDALRWSLKSVMASYLLQHDSEKVIYVDNDIYFYQSPDFLFEELETSSFLLTPHFYKANPEKEQNWLEANYRVGLYNAGFFGVTKDALPILNWWTKCCLYEVKKAFWRGLFDDQKYLDLVPVLFEKVAIIKHRGCNLAGWNDEHYRIDKQDGKLTVNEQPVIFVHFAELTMERFSQPHHPLHLLYHTYFKNIKHYDPEFQWKPNKTSKISIQNAWYYLKWRFARKWSGLLS